MEQNINPGQDLVIVGEIGTYGAEKLLELYPEEISKRFSTFYLSEEKRKLSEQNAVMEQWYHAAREARAEKYKAEAESECKAECKAKTELKSEFESKSEADPIEFAMPGYRKIYGVTGIRKVEKGGILKALWDFCEAAAWDPETGRKKGYGLGCEFRYDSIPVSQFTMEICELFDVLPYRLWSRDCFLMTMEKGDHFCLDFLEMQLRASKNLADETFAKGARVGFDSEQHVRTTEPVKASVFGRITKEKKRIRVDGTEIGYLTRESYEELERFI